MFPILLTTSNEKQLDTAVAWDPLAGNPIATLAGELAQRNTVHRFCDGVICAAAKKPLVQIWNFQSTTSNYRRILTKGVVNALAVTQDQQYMFIAFDQEVYVYQCNSGCLVGLLDGTHSAKIGAIKLTDNASNHPQLLVTADVSGLMACWSLGDVMDTDRSLPMDANTTTQLFDATTDANSTSPENVVTSRKHTPLWYTLQASHGLPHLEFMEDNVLVAGTAGLKVYKLYDGNLVGVTLTSNVGGIHSLAVIQNRGLIYCGANEGIVYTSRFHLPQGVLSTSRQVRRCFVDSTLPAGMKAVTELAVSPFDADLLFVGAKGGQIEVLRTNDLLTSLKQFSILNPAISSTHVAPPQLTGLCLIARPDWLSIMRRNPDAKKAVFNEQDAEHKSVFCGLEPLKHYLGWRIQDSVRVRLLPSSERSTDHTLADVFLDNFLDHPERDQMEADDSKGSELTSLENQVEKLTSTNRELLRRLIYREMKTA